MKPTIFSLQSITGLPNGFDTLDLKEAKDLAQRTARLRTNFETAATLLQRMGLMMAPSRSCAMSDLSPKCEQ